MKRLCFIIGLIGVILFSSCSSKKGTYTYNPTSEITHSKKLSGTEAKVNEWESKGYSITGSMGTFTMYDLLEMHNKKIIENQDHLIPVFGTGTGSDKTTARFSAQANASATYATSAGSVVSGGMSQQFSNFGDMGLKLMGAYTQKVSEYITPFMKESVAVYRIIKDPGKDHGKYEYEVYYIIDENDASKVRKDAMDAALKETATEQIFGSAVDEWVKKFVSTDTE